MFEGRVKDMEERYLQIALDMVRSGVKEQDGYRLETIGLIGCHKSLLLRDMKTDKAVIRLRV